MFCTIKADIFGSYPAARTNWQACSMVNLAAFNVIEPVHTMRPLPNKRHVDLGSLNRIVAAANFLPVEKKVQ